MCMVPSGDSLDFRLPEGLISVVACDAAFVGRSVERVCAGVRPDAGGLVAMDGDLLEGAEAARRRSEPFRRGSKLPVHAPWNARFDMQRGRSFSLNSSARP